MNVVGVELPVEFQRAENLHELQGSPGTLCKFQRQWNGVLGKR